MLHVFTKTKQFQMKLTQCTMSFSQCKLRYVYLCISIGHEGVVWQCDFSFNSSRILTGSGDKRVILWETQTGKKLDEWTHNSQVRTVQFAIGDRMFVAATDSSFSQTPSIYIYNLSESGRK